MTIIAIDCGNSRIKATAFDGERLTTDDAMAHDELHRLDRLAEAVTPEAAIVVATGRDDAAVTALISRHCTTMVLNRESRLPYGVAYDRQSIGMDRVAAAAGAAASSPGTRCLVADAGTALTLDVVDADGTMAGGYIVPGMTMMLNALHEHTALLPALDIAGDEPRHGQLPLDTAHAMRWGAMLAAAAQVDAAATRHGCATVLVTGGNAPLLSRHLTCAHTVDPHLVARGLKTILQFNIDNGYV